MRGIPLLRISCGVIIGISLALVTLPAVQGDAGKADPRVYPTGEKVADKTYAEWTVAWWQWAAAIKKDKNPIVDKTGKFSGEGQSGPVWFLTGTFTNDPAVRKCSVPAGKPIFLPVVNHIANAPADKAKDKDLLAEAKAKIDTAADLELVIDGKPVPDVMQYRVASAPFSFTCPDKEADAAEPTLVGKQRGASDGYWVMLKPLSPGEHTIRFKGKVKAEKFALDVTYHLTVVAEKKP